MLIEIPGNETSITLSHVESSWVFALSANTVNGSTGLSPGWLCKYQYHALPAKPQLINATDTTGDSIKVQWYPQSCDTSPNKARVSMYILQMQNINSGNMTIKHSMRTRGSTRKVRLHTITV